MSPYTAGAAAPGSEWLRALRRRLLGRKPREPGAVNHVSLGCHCHMAQVLKTLGLRTWSGPFDWIFTTPGMVRDCLADDFAALLDRDQLESVPLDERPEPGLGRGRHRLYRERHDLPFVFNHHDPATDEADYAFLSEGVRRLRAALGRPGADNHFWMMTALGAEEATIAEICDILARHGPKNRMTFLQIRPGLPELRATTRPRIRENLRWIDLDSPSESVGLRFADAAADAFLARIVTGDAAVTAQS